MLPFSIEGRTSLFYKQIRRLFLLDCFRYTKENRCVGNQDDFQKKKWLKAPSFTWIGIIAGFAGMTVFESSLFKRADRNCSETRCVPYGYYHHMHHERHHYEEQYMANDFDEVGLIQAF